jgi:magnesium chelatase subunit D
LIDTEPKSFIKIGIGENIAKKYRFRYFKIDDLCSDEILKVVNRVI